jgi:CRP-like cAMP-binding protein
LDASRNDLVDLLPLAERRSLVDLCTPVSLDVGEILCRSGSPTRFVYFPLDGFISMVTQTAGDPGLEVGLIGAEGMLGASLSLGVDSAPLHALVQGAGAALRLGRVDFQRHLAQSPRLRQEVSRYLFVLMTQLATAAACVRFHRILPRLARWLLMTQDRARSERFHVTHEFLAHMLGVRRVSITEAASALQSRAVISYSRGHLVVLDRLALEAEACTCYAADCSAYVATFPSGAPK